MVPLGLQTWYGILGCFKFSKLIHFDPEIEFGTFWISAYSGWSSGSHIAAEYFKFTGPCWDFTPHREQCMIFIMVRGSDLVFRRLSRSRVPDWVVLRFFGGLMKYWNFLFCTSCFFSCVFASLIGSITHPMAQRSILQSRDIELHDRCRLVLENDASD